MEKINVAELLKDCPKGMELDCTVYNNVTLEYVCKSNSLPICIRIQNRGTMFLSRYGQFHDEDCCKCVIFPKGKTTWEGFVPPVEFKDGDIVFTHANCLKVGLGNTWISIFQEKRNGVVATYVDYAEDGDGFYSYNEDKALLCMEEDIMRQRFATEEEKQKLFDAIKANGYKWNAETKTLEKLPKFKVGDRIRLKNGGSIIEVTSVNNDSSICVNGMSWTIKIKQQDNYELVPNKFDITNLKPFESKVLVRDSKKFSWRPALYGGVDYQSLCPFITVGGMMYKCMIPYEGNEHLLGTTNDCDEFYKTWEKRA